MHRAWHIEEIRLMIFELLEPGDFARLARTNRDLFEIATDHLWYTLTSVEPFVSCLPPHVTTEKLGVEDLVRLDLYAEKVRVLRLEEENANRPIRLPSPFRPVKNTKKQKPRLGWQQQQKHLVDLWGDLWTHIAQLRPSHLFLPNLRSLRVNNIVESLLLPLVGISGAQLAYVYVKIIHERQPDSVVKRFLEQLQDVNKLEYLFVRNGDPDLVPTNLITEAPLNHLRLDVRSQRGDAGVKCFPLRAEILQKSTIQHLTLGLNRDWYNSDIQTLQQKYFPDLKTLWLNLRTFQPEDCQGGCMHSGLGSWTCRHSSFGRDDHDDKPGTYDCGRKPPNVFFEGLDNPALELLNIRFLYSVNGKNLLNVMKAASTYCQLTNLAELVLSSGGWLPHCSECGALPQPAVAPQHLKDTMKMLLPLPKLKVLRLTLVPNLVTNLDHDFNKLMAEGLPALRILSIGRGSFLTGDQFTGIHVYERLPLNHIAAFCSSFPALADVQVGCVDLTVLEETPHEEWACPQITTLRVDRWVHYDITRADVMISRDQFFRTLTTYFPNSDMAKKDFKRESYLFEQR